jgi:hypothetical protein
VNISFGSGSWSVREVSDIQLRSHSQSRVSVRGSDLAVITAIPLRPLGGHVRISSARDASAAENHAVRDGRHRWHGVGRVDNRSVVVGRSPEPGSSVDRNRMGSSLGGTRRVGR